MLQLFPCASFFPVVSNFIIGFILSISKLLLPAVFPAFTLLLPQNVSSTMTSSTPPAHNAETTTTPLSRLDQGAFFNEQQDFLCKFLDEYLAFSADKKDDKKQ
jgi:hypothetical protein